MPTSASRRWAGRGTFSDPRIGLNIIQKPDLVTSKLAALRDYQLGLPAPPAPPGSFDASAAVRGERVFNGKGTCASCHPAPTFTDVGRPRIRPSLFFTIRQPSGPNPSMPRGVRPGSIAPLPCVAPGATRLISTTGSAADLLAVVNHYDRVLELKLSPSQKADLVEFLKSL